MITISLKEFVLIFVGGSFAAVTSMLSLMMIGQINEKLPEGQRMSYWRWGPIRKLHRQLYPKSKMVLALDICGAGVVVCFFIAVIFF